MASCLSGGGRTTYRLDLDIIKSPSSTSWISNSPSPSSSLSESSNSQIAISTRKPRTPRKRPNETYNEAAAMLSKIFPKLFPTKHLPKACKFTKQKYPFTNESLSSSSSDLLVPFQAIENSSFLIHPTIMLENPKIPVAAERSLVNSCEKPCLSPGEITSSTGFCGEKLEEDFDAESILDEEIEEGIESILGNLNVENESNGYCGDNSFSNQVQVDGNTTCYGYPVELGHKVDFENGFGTRNYMRAFRNYDNGEWWGFNSVNIDDITPKFSKIPMGKKKKKKKVEKPKKVVSISKILEQKKGGGGGAKVVEEEEEDDDSIPPPTKANSSGGGLLLKLDYDGVLNAWSDRDSPFPDDSPAAAEAVGNGVQARLCAIDLFTENGGIREASVLRYKEKRMTRLFSKKIRYQVRKVNADQRPRMQGRFVRRTSSPEESEQG